MAQPRLCSRINGLVPCIMVQVHRHVITLSPLPLHGPEPPYLPILLYPPELFCYNWRFPPLEGGYVMSG